MTTRSKVSRIALPALGLLLLIANICSAVTPDELQKIENAAPAAAKVKPAKPRKLLVFTLCKGFKHSAVPYCTKALESIGKKTGAFEVVESNDMSVFEPENLGKFDAVCLNNTTKLDFSSEALRKSLMDFVKGGKGIIGIHAATDNFYDWPEAAEMMGGFFDGHPWGAGGTWAVKIDDTEHPLTAAFKGEGFKISDEIYRIKGFSREKLRVLVSLDMADEATRSAKGIRPADTDIPISWVRSCGRGRVFYCSFGHNHDVLWNGAVLQHYLDGIQYALGDLPADSKPSLEKWLSQVAAYEFGQSRQPLTALTDFVRSVQASPDDLRRIEERFLELLRSGATPAGKQFICRQLSVIGTDRSVPALAAMLKEKATSQIEPADMARYALERIPGKAAAEALRTALGETGGKVKIGIINSIGERADNQAVEQLKGLLADNDKGIAEAAIAALGKIGGKEAADALRTGVVKQDDPFYPVWADAYLSCADKLAAQGDSGFALRVYKDMNTRGGSSQIRIAALQGMVRVEPERADSIIIGALKSDDEQMQTAGVGLLRLAPGSKAIEGATAQLPQLSVAAQVQLLGALADIRAGSAMPAIIKASKSSAVDVRVAALDALGVLGDASAVGLLAETAAKTQDAEQKTAREALYGLRDPKANESILAGLAKAESKVKVELIRAIGQRNIAAGADALLKTARDAQDEVRLESLKVLKIVAESRHLPALVELLTSAKSEAERAEADGALLAVARKMSDASLAVSQILSALASAKEVQARCSLLQVAGRIGGNDALTALRKALKDKNSEVRTTAIRAFSDWPNPEPMADLREIAERSEDKTQRVLALRGFIRLIGLESDRPAEQTVDLYKAAMQLATDSPEKKTILSGLSNVKSVGALMLASDYLADSALQQEAEAAVVKIAESTAAAHPQETKTAMQKVVQTSKNDSLRKRAEKIINQIEQSGK